MTIYGRRAGGSSAASVNAWTAPRQRALDPLVSGLNYVYVKPSNIQQATDAASPTISARDASIIGGGMSPAGVHWLTCTGVISTDITTQPYAWAARGKFTAPSANYQGMGAVDTTAANYAVLAAFTSYDATHLVLELFKTGGGTTRVVTSHTIDGNAHDYGIAFDGTTYSALVDDVVVGSTAVLTNLTSGARVWAAFNQTAGDIKVYDLVYGYRIP